MKRGKIYRTSHRMAERGYKPGYYVVAQSVQAPEVERWRPAG